MDIDIELIFLQSGQGQLTVEFDGMIDEQLHGFYRTKDQNQIGACTQFEVNFMYLLLLLFLLFIHLAWLRTSCISLF